MTQSGIQLKKKNVLRREKQINHDNRVPWITEIHGCIPDYQGRGEIEVMQLST